MRSILFRSTASLLAALLGLGLMSVTTALAQTLDPVATTAKAATVSLAAPAPAGDRTILDLRVRAFTPPSRGTVQAVVTLFAPNGAEQEIGRFAIFPTESFSAKTVGQERAFQFDATSAITMLQAGGGPLAVKVQLVPADPTVASADAQLTVGQARFTRRP